MKKCANELTEQIIFKGRSTKANKYMKKCSSSLAIKEI
jgi:hypothetical protein